jgi:hypothetical protein
MAHDPGSLSLHAHFKVRYADRIGKYLSATSICQEKFPYKEKYATGELYRVPILTRRVQDAKYATSGAGEVAFGDIKSSKIVQADLKGTQLFMSNACDWESATSSDSKGVKSFSDEFDLVVYDLWDSARFRIEMSILWGQFVNGTIGKISGAPAGNVITLLAADRSPGILYNLENAKLEIFDSALTTLRAGTHTVTAVDPEAGTITVSAIGAAVDTDIIFFSGEVSATFTHNNMAGLAKWSTNFTGSLAGISASNNIVWKPTEVDVGNGPLTMDHILSAAKNIQFRGHRGKMCALISLGAWNDAMSDMSATVRRTPSERKYVLGAEAISFFTGAGEVEVIAHPYQKNGHGFLFPVMTPNSDGSYNEDVVESSPIRRIGATDLAFVGPDGRISGSKRQEYFEKIQRTNLLSIDVYSHQALFPTVPSRLVHFVNVVNS